MRFNILAILLVSFLVSCSSQIKIRALRPAEIDLKNAKTIGIGNFDFSELKYFYLDESEGKWNVQEGQLQAKELASLFRAALLNEFSKNPKFRVILVDDFLNVTENAGYNQLLPRTGFIRPKLDALIQGSLRMHMTSQSGEERRKVTLKTVAKEKQKKKWIVKEDISEDIISSFPYKTLLGTVLAKIEVSELQTTEQLQPVILNIPVSIQMRKGGESKLPKNDFGYETYGLKTSFNDKIFAPDIFVQNLASQISALFAPKLSITSQEITKTIDQNGEEVAVSLIESEAFEHAIKRLERINAEQEKRAPNLYNLGVAYEALGEYGIAKQMYGDALDKDHQNELYLSSLVEIEKRIFAKKNRAKTT